MERPGAIPAQSEVEGSSSAGEPRLRFSPRAPRAVAKPNVPDYELIRRIGHGAYGDVWLARSQATGVLRAAKIVWRHTFEDEKPFQREFAGIQRFERISREHPSQLALFHIGRNDPAGYFYYVMELADPAEPVGEDGGLIMEDGGKSESMAHHPRSSIFDPRLYKPHTLRADLGKGRLPAGKVLEIGLALSEALAHLHSRGLVHRDVKPSNVIFVNGRPKLADIGLVTDASDQCSIVGTEGYLPPEGPGTSQADIFALGKVLYEAATGRDRREFPKLPDDLRSWPDATQVFELNEIILKACAPVAGQRYPTAQAILGELALLQDGKSVRRKRTWQTSWSAGKKTAIALAAFAMMAALVSQVSRHSASPEPSSDGPDSTNLDANAYCDKGLLILRGDNYTQVGAAYADFTNAIGLDPNFARPYVGLLELRAREDVAVTNLPDASAGEFRSIGQHLKKLAPHLPSTYIAEAVVNSTECKFGEAERSMREAIESNPNCEFAHTYYSWLLDCFGRTDEALAQLKISQKLAPSKVIVFRCFGNTYYVARNYLKAIEWYQKAINWEPHHFVAWNGVGISLLALGDYTNALPYLETNDLLHGADAVATKQSYAVLRRALDEQGPPGFWMQRLQWAGTDTNADLLWKAEIQMHLGDTNAALALLEQSYATHERQADPDPPLEHLLYDADLEGLHSHPRFKKLLDEVGLTKVMRPPGR